MRRLALELRDTIRSIARAIDIEGALLIFAVGALTVLAYDLFTGWQGALTVLAIAALVGAVLFARAPRTP